MVDSLAPDVEIGPNLFKRGARPARRLQKAAQTGILA